MIDLSNNIASIHKTVPMEKLFDPSLIESYQMTDVIWVMSIKPGIRNVTAYVEGQIRMEEIEVFDIQVNALPEAESYIGLLTQLYKKIAYPCVVFFEYKDKYRIACWSFKDSVYSTNNNILLTPYISSWIYDPPSSEKTRVCVEQVAAYLLNGEGSIRDLYQNICLEVSKCAPKHITSKEHLIRLVYDLTGDKKHPIINEIESRKRHGEKYRSSRYQKKQYTKPFTHVYEYEDIWHAFMCDEKIKKTIENRRYSDIEELVMRIDMKYGQSSW